MGARGAAVAAAGATSGLATEGPHARASEGDDATIVGREREGESEGAAEADGSRPDAEDAEMDWLDPAARQAAQLAPLSGGGGPTIEGTSQASEAPLRGRSLEELLPALVKRIAWAGDRHRGTVRLELGAGAHAGTTVVVHADGGRVRVELAGTEGLELDRLRARLDARLRGHGLDVESVT